MDIQDNTNPTARRAQNDLFIDLIEAGATVEGAAKIAGITPEELAECRAIDPELDADLEEFALWATYLK